MKKVLILFVLVSGRSLAQTAPITVTVLNFENVPYAGDKVYFVAQDKSGTFSGITDQKGRFHIDLPAGAIYDIKIKSIGDEVEYNTIEVPTLGEGQFFQEMELTISYEAARNFEITALQFETGKSVLQRSSYHLLDDLVEIMKLKPTMKIEISGHTDSDGADADNLMLSQQRADAVRSYLISQGIAGNRMVSKGYGETRPKESNSTAQGKARNRRTEITIL
jgi:outer membrane protein OmpA-like peptidoglycan-associated protein